MYTSLKSINPASVAPTPFSHGFIIPAGYDILVTAGQIGTIGPQGIIPRSYEDQVTAAIQKLGTILTEVGATPQDIIKLTYYIVDYDESNRGVHINALQRFLGDHKPATTLIGVDKLANSKLKFEIEAIVAIKPGSKGEARASRLA